MIIRNGMIHDAIHEEPYQGDILVRDGKLMQVGGNVAAGEAEEEVIDAEGMNVYPGFVDCHSHIGLDNFAGPTGTTYDYNEMNDVCSPQLRGIDSYYPQDRAIPTARQGGVTTVATGPGSANVLGGTFLAVKLYGESVDKAVVNPCVAMKCAFGENPKRCYKNSTDCTRMTNASILRKALFEARDYMLRKEAAGGDILKQPKFDMKCEALIPVLKRQIPLKAHAHRADDILTAVRIAREFDVKLTIEHCTDGNLIVEELKEAGYPVCVGPSLGVPSKLELVNKSFTTPGVLAAAGVHVSIITDAPVIPEQYLAMCAGFAVKEGMDPFQALQAITIHPAEHLGIEDRVGSLEIGKDADIVICEGNPMYTYSQIHYVIIDGKVLEKM